MSYLGKVFALLLAFGSGLALMHFISEPQQGFECYRPKPDKETTRDGIPVLSWDCLEFWHPTKESDSVSEAKEHGIDYISLYHAAGKGDGDALVKFLKLWDIMDASAGIEHGRFVYNLLRYLGDRYLPSAIMEFDEEFRKEIFISFDVGCAYDKKQSPDYGNENDFADILRVNFPKTYSALFDGDESLKNYLEERENEEQ